MKTFDTCCLASVLKRRHCPQTPGYWKSTLTFCSFCTFLSCTFNTRCWHFQCLRYYEIVILLMNPVGTLSIYHNLKILLDLLRHNWQIKLHIFKVKKNKKNKKYFWNQINVRHASLESNFTVITGPWITKSAHYLERENMNQTFCIL